ncbi:2-succinyl-6-hydroxy-2,4-cyclohexadiene-1-carboxylate synthase [Litchfieldia salsa]|uniref:Putative 2-succinyl-6-hydroxy-2,4-cyclohexadiene-1-carboxylate synthase n=1 Tax=Litchfieldia salsa TaxID=930152 RepID=A0A1H0QGP3_9BACI|nr:2-succinyl-6-hydroxy-2,4-cyclohexadiene-1-carboxylate synthase [Litchfieldia salsa]SDP16225.1 2-succinyl-6-hydroxy-2,4-cyclohexadiene-1-carboxylate synthase [Litchfieldia salsa]
MYIDVKGIYYNVRVVGEGEPLIFLHGFTGSIENWDVILPYLKGHYQLIFIDLIGHGGSDSPSEIIRYQFLNIRDDVITILDQLKIQDASLIGYSMGGRLALSLIVEYPKRFSKLVLESSSPGIEKLVEREERKKADEKLAKFIEQDGLRKFVDYWENISLFESQRRIEDNKRKFLHVQRLKNNVVGLSNSLRGMGTGVQPSYWNQLHEVKIPVLLLCGELDQKFCMIAEKMATLLTNAEIKKINRAGHAIHMEQPENFGKIVSVFLSR